jgi:hypothetical protein
MLVSASTTTIHGVVSGRTQTYRGGRFEFEFISLIIVRSAGRCFERRDSIGTKR